MAYVLSIDDKPVAAHHSLPEARGAAKPYIDRKLAVTIASHVAPAPSELWYFDYELPGWVKRQ